ncbi:Serine/threonine-protein kinase PknD [Sinobacterium norvegicum]|uniref:Serine/threonine-protein kinase PknD n=1 Tax=Sinobacterium norvegicum TaxID=1641715 RepID=A0ABM9ADA1_9GAMM|nr:serine/threonine-protein kinase [Sinobacterium norvegicum]CAH0991155.1 Serine/threonine-protein kinase PknD [Sinobacterium norvegicum]
MIKSRLSPYVLLRSLVNVYTLIIGLTLYCLTTLFQPDGTAVGWFDRLIIDQLQQPISQGEIENRFIIRILNSEQIEQINTGGLNAAALIDELQVFEGARLKGVYIASTLTPNKVYSPLMSTYREQLGWYNAVFPLNQPTITDFFDRYRWLSGWAYEYQHDFYPGEIDDQLKQASSAAFYDRLLVGLTSALQDVHLSPLSRDIILADVEQQQLSAAFNLLTQAVDKKSLFVRDNKGRLSVEGKQYAASFNGSMTPLLAVDYTRLVSDVNLPENAANKILLIGDGESIAAFIEEYISLEREHYLTTSTAELTYTLLTIMLTVLVFLSVCYFCRSGYVVLVGGLFLLVSLAVQIGFAMFEQVWLPLSSLYILIPATILLYFSERILTTPYRQLEHQLAAQSLSYANELQQLSRFDESLAVVKNGLLTPDIVQFIYQLAQRSQAEMDRQGALAALTFLHKNKRGYKDVKEQLSQLQPLSETRVLTTDDDATVLIPASSRKIVSQLGRYNVIKELGRGAMGVVYLGKDPKISRKVAIKTLDYQQLPEDSVEAFKQRFFQEAKAVGRLDHPNIVKIFDMGEERHLAFIAMDFIEGEPLKHFCQSNRLLPPELVYNLCIQVADALDYAHSKQIIHRDVKPHNIMFNPETNTCKLTDFGIARLTDDSRTRTGEIMGSPLYMSPEQLKGLPLDARCDVFSLGVTLYQLLTGQTPFNGEGIANIAYQVVSGKFDAIKIIKPELPPSATRITNKAMHKNPDKRYKDAAEMAKALRASLRRDF